VRRGPHCDVLQVTRTATICATDESVARREVSFRLEVLVVTVSRSSSASPEAVWSALSEGWSYATSVVGASRIRDVDRTWPERCARIHHSISAWPFMLNDTTRVLHAEPKRAMTLQAKAQVAGHARVQLLVAPEGTGSVITQRKDVSHGLGRLAPLPLRWSAIAPRNRDCLRRVALLAERHSG